MKKIVIYGGSFNPPTIAHQEVINKLSKKFNEVWVIPSAVHRQKSNLIDIEHRKNMLNLTFENIGKSNVKIFSIEEEVDFQGKAYLLMDYIKKLEPKSKFYYVIGKDIINNIKNWYNYKEFIAENNFLIMPRKGVKSTNANLDLFFLEGKDNIIATTLDIPEVSSTLAREIISFNYTSPEDYLRSYIELETVISENVLKYIESNNLYHK